MQLPGEIFPVVKKTCWPRHLWATSNEVSWPIRRDHNTFLSARRWTHPSLSASSIGSNIVLFLGCFILSSLSILLSTRVSSPSMEIAGLGVLASMTKWLSQWGQYSSASSNSLASLRKHFLHFLQANVISNVWRRGCDSCSWWHWAQSNHFLPTMWTFGQRRTQIRLPVKGFQRDITRRGVAYSKGSVSQPARWECACWDGC